MATKSPQAFRTISEVSDALDVPPHVLRFWESRFAQVKPVKRGGGRRYYRPEDICLLRGIRGLLYEDGMTIKGVQKILREKGVRHVVGLGTIPLNGAGEPPGAAEMPPALAAKAAAAKAAVERFGAGRSGAGLGHLLDSPFAPKEPGGSSGARGTGSPPPDRQADLFPTGRELAEAPGFAEPAAAPPTLDAPASARDKSGEGSVEQGMSEAKQEEAGGKTAARTEAGKAGAGKGAAGTSPGADRAGRESSEGRDARRDALRKLIAEFQALRERMAEGM